jgi:hypothetical protein
LFLASGTQYEESVNTALDEVLDESFEALYVERLVILQRCNERWNNTT